MSFDYSRFTFNPWNDFNGVVMAQGRVQLDADWNEWLEELRRRIRAGSLDSFGRAVYPATTPNAFKIVPSSSAPIAIGVGRMYVDGLLVENHGLTAVPMQGWVPASTAKPGGAGATWDDSLDELILAGPVAYDKQPYYPNPPALASGGPYLVYLDVWQREVTFLEDPDLIEKAVGVDTTGRMQTVWQVKALDVSKADGGKVSCATPNGDLGWPPKASGGRLTTSVVQSSPAGVCCLTPNTGYTGMENQLYRVEIQTGGAVGTATFNWSRDNASVSSAVTAIDGNVATMQRVGKDSVLTFHKNDWVEITDDWLELNGQPGELHQVVLVDNTNQTLTLSAAVTGSFAAGNPTRHTRAICWNGANIPVPAAGTAVTLENGVTVSFDLDPALGDFQTGDFWTFAARATDGTVESLVQAPPQGIHHHYARLSVLTLPLNNNEPSDCRTPWPPQEGGGCDCASCVTAESHNNGTWTIQNGIDAARVKGGGKVCLGPGVYNIVSTIIVGEDAEGITLCGHGMPELLPAGVTGSILLVQEANDIVIEGIAFVGGSGGGVEIFTTELSGLIGITIAHSLFVTVQDCHFGAPSDITLLSTAIAYAGMVIYSTIQRNLFVNVGNGIGLTTVTGNHNSWASLVGPSTTMLTQITITENKMYCYGGALFWPPSEEFSAAEIRFAQNFVQSTSGVVIEPTVLRTNVIIDGNTFALTPTVAGEGYPYDAAVVSSCSQTRVSDNEISANTTTLTAVAGSGGAIGQGSYIWAVTAVDALNRERLVTSLATLALTGNQNAVTLRWEASAYATKYNIYRTNQDTLFLVDSVDGNTLSFVDKVAEASLGQEMPTMQNDGVVLLLPKGDTDVMYGSQITDNRIGGLAGTAILMPSEALLVQTIISRNQLLTLGGSGIALAHLALDIDIVGNSIFGAGLIPVADLVGIGLNSGLKASISENRIEGIGPAATAPFHVVGIKLDGGADVRIAGNCVVDVGPLASSESMGVSAIATGRLDVLDNEVRRASAVPQQQNPPQWLALGLLGETVNVRGNLFESYGLVRGDGILLQSTHVQASTVYIQASGSCLFSDNQCFQDNRNSASALVVEILAQTIIAMGNRVQGPAASPGNKFSMSLEDGSSGKAGMLTAVGNITTAGIGVPTAALPPPWQPLNITA